MADEKRLLSDQAPLRPYLKGVVLVECSNRCKRFPEPWHCHVHLTICLCCGGEIKIVGRVPARG